MSLRARLQVLALEASAKIGPSGRPSTPGPSPGSGGNGGRGEP